MINDTTWKKNTPGLERAFSPLKSDPDREFQAQIIKKLWTNEEDHLRDGYGMILDFLPYLLM